MFVECLGIFPTERTAVAYAEALAIEALRVGGQRPFQHLRGNAGYNDGSMQDFDFDDEYYGHENDAEANEEAARERVKAIVNENRDAI